MTDRAKRIVLFAVVVCVVGSAWYLAYYRSLRRSIQSLEAAIATRRQHVDKGSRMVVIVPLLQKQAEEVRDELALRKTAFPHADALPELTTHLMELGDPLGLRLVASEPLEMASEGIAGKGGIGTLRIRLHLEGPFLSVGKYMERVADLPCFAGFGGFDCRREEGQLSVNAIVELYVHVLERKEDSGVQNAADTGDRSSVIGHPPVFPP